MTTLNLTRVAGVSLLAVELFCVTGCQVERRAQPAAEQSGDRHWLVIVDGGAFGLRIAEAHLVASALPRTRAPRNLRWRVEIEDGAGRRLFSESIAEGGVRRGVHAQPGEAPAAARTPMDTFSFPVRLPVIGSATRIRFVDTRPDQPSDLLAAGETTPAEVQLGVLPYPANPP